jgi:hypothetical protein
MGTRDISGPGTDLGRPVPVLLPTPIPSPPLPQTATLVYSGSNSSQPPSHLSQDQMTVARVGSSRTILLGRHRGTRSRLGCLLLRRGDMIYR